MDLAHCEKCSDFFKGRIEFSANSSTLHDGLKILDYQVSLLITFVPAFFQLHWWLKTGPQLFINQIPGVLHHAQALIEFPYGRMSRG
ncbi:hypothetical protein T02_3895 [Trichinella nativa]|uniref:Uncharacterized protein n=1 Tax=Trichinella nativa TaxID=6335 RepID=A0A0V1KUA8_9BILA|nr:hypothetical protein T02_3895 [Trichinella nativa]